MYLDDICMMCTQIISSIKAIHYKEGEWDAIFYTVVGGITP